MKTWKNKIISLALIIGGYLSMRISGDGTAFVFFLIIGVPIFFMKESIVSADHADYYIDKDGNLHKIKKKETRDDEI